MRRVLVVTVCSALVWSACDFGGDASGYRDRYCQAFCTQDGDSSAACLSDCLSSDAGAGGGAGDGGGLDSGTPDAGEPDAGEPDAGQPDAGQPDAGQPDAGQPDAGQPDAGCGAIQVTIADGSGASHPVGSCVALTLTRAVSSDPGCLASLSVDGGSHVGLAGSLSDCETGALAQVLSRGFAFTTTVWMRSGAFGEVPLFVTEAGAMRSFPVPFSAHMRLASPDGGAFYEGICNPAVVTAFGADGGSVVPLAPTTIAPTTGNGLGISSSPSCVTSDGSFTFLGFQSSTSVGLTASASGQLSITWPAPYGDGSSALVTVRPSDGGCLPDGGC